MAALDTVSDYVTQARVLLQDQIEEYRYPTADLVMALNMALMEMKRIRPDLVFNTTFQFYVETDPGATVPVDTMYRIAVLYYIVGQAQLRDDEETQDQRAAAFLNMFTSKLLAVS